MIWEQIAANRRRSAVLITILALVLCVMGVLLGEAIAPGGGGLVGLLIALIVLLVQYAIYATQPAALLLQGANAAELRREDNPRLFNIVEEMKIASGLPFMPRIYVIDDPAPNAFAMGRGEANGIIAVTTGLLRRLNRDELQGVVAHEIGHLRNRDVQFMTLAAVMLGTIVILSEIFWRSMRYGGRIRSRSNSRGAAQGQALFLLIGLALAILAPILAQLLYFACSRKREYLADACGAQFTRYPEGLASALEKISAAPQVSFASRATAPMFIVNPLAARGDGSTLFSTHPPTAERIRILRSMAGASLLDYEAAFRKSTGKALIRETTLSRVGSQAIREPSKEEPDVADKDARHAVYQQHGYIPIHCNCGMELSVPRRYERGSVKCPRCGTVLTVPRAVPPVPPPLPSGSKSRQAMRLEYHRRGGGWEAFRCVCGHTVRLAPSFEGAAVECPKCHRIIRIV